MPRTFDRLFESAGASEKTRQNLSIPYMLVKILFFYLGTLLYMIDII